MAAAKPSLILKFDIDGSLEDDELIDELKRTYSYIAPVKVAFHEAGEPAVGTLGFNVISHSPYWGADGDGYWKQTVLPWLERVLRKLDKTLEAHVGIRSKRGVDDLSLREVVAVFGSNGEVRLPLSPDGALPEDAVERIADARRRG